MKKRLRFQMPHVPLKVLRGEQDKEDIQDQYYERFQAPPGTSTEEEANALRRSSSSHWDSTTDIGNASESVGSIHSISESDNASDERAEDVPSDHIDLSNTGYQTTGSVSHEAIELQGFSQVHQPPNTGSGIASVGNVSEEAMGRYLGENTGSIHNASQSDPGSHEGVGNLHNNTGYETTDSVSHEAIALQSFAQVHQPPNTESGVTINTDNISEEAMGRYLGRHTSSIDNVSQSDTASDEAIELQGFSQVHQPPNTDSDIVSISNISAEIMRRYLGEHTGSQHGASQSDTASHEGVVNVHNDQINNTGYESMGRDSHEDIEMQVLPQTHQLSNIDNDDSNVL